MINKQPLYNRNKGEWHWQYKNYKGHVYGIHKWREAAEGYINAVESDERFTEFLKNKTFDEKVKILGITRPLIEH